MARIDLNIVDRGIGGSEWIAADKSLTTGDLDKVIEQKTDNSAALNSLPTPFARFFVAKEAFRRTMEEYKDSKKEAGFAYRQIVSDILDVYELLFNLKYHQNSWDSNKTGEKLEIKEWNYAEEIDSLKRNMPVLYNSIKEYYKTDINEDNLYFVVYSINGKEMLLACSSPLTGFVTPPDLDKNQRAKDVSYSISIVGNQYENLNIRRKSGGRYFQDTKMFEDRDADFKNYMYNMFSAEDSSNRFQSLRTYIRCFENDKDIRYDINPILVNIKTDQNDDLTVNGLTIKMSDEIDINSFFLPTLIRMSYRINRDNFKSVVYQNDDNKRDYDYLLPFKPEILNLYEDGIIDSDLHINRNSVTVILRFNGIEYKKEYATDPIKHGIGRIVDLKSAKINFDLGIFPNILSYKPAENNYFKVLVVAADEDPDAPHFNIDKISLSFYRKSNEGFLLVQEVDPELTGAQFGVYPAVVRSRQNTGKADGGTKFYELFNTSFNAIEIKIGEDTGLLLHNWKESKATDDAYTYAIDLGTSNTFMSRCKNGSNNLPELFKMENSMVNYLHETADNTQFSFAKRIENSIFEQAKNKVKTEFLPAIIDGYDYKFPIRTALCGIRNKKDTPRLFDNHNIAFFYEKMMAKDDQHIITDIKWEKNDDLLRLFIRELLLIIKCDILQRNGVLNLTKLVWFRPLSFMGNVRNTYNVIWKSEPRDILSISENQISCFSESEAPYYYFKKKDYIKDSDTVTVIDIGGGSTDFVYFKDNLPQMANSVHFGCDVLWENGFSEFDDEKENGIYKRYANTLRFKRQDLEDLNTFFKMNKTSKTKDIINFWLSNSDSCDITKKLGEDFKPIFTYHLTAILFYMSYMYKENNLAAPKTVVFSGNGSKYIDNFISSEDNVLKKIIDLIFCQVFGGEHDINIKLPTERKESTCYGGLYRDTKAPTVPEKIYQGDVSHIYETVGDINNNFSSLKDALLSKYKQLAKVYKDVLDLLKKEMIIDNTADTSIYWTEAAKDMEISLSNYYKSQVKEKYNEEVTLYDSVFFLPIINRIFEMTKI